MRLISASVNARRFDSAFDLNSLTRTAGLTVSNPCRTASPRQIRSTFTLRLAVERDSSFASPSRNRAMSLACSVERSRLLFASPRKPFHHALVARVGRFLRLDCFGFRPCLAPRLDGRARQRFHVCRRENVADTTSDDFARSVHAQFAVARFERGLVPRAADFERLLLIASFGGAKDAPAAIRLRIEH